MRVSVIERHRIFTPFGIRFWDPVLDTPIDTGLTAHCYPQNAPDNARRAFRTGSGIYAFSGLPGLQDVEYPAAGDIESVAAIPFVIEVEDTKSRFYGISAIVSLPFEEPGLFPQNISGDGADVQGFYLFSTPARGVPVGIGVMRAALVDEITEEPAAFAALEVEIESVTWRGFADDRGNAAVLFPFPAVDEDLSEGSGSGLKPLPDQEWPAIVRVLYEPGSVSLSSVAGLPDFESLVNQNEAMFVPDEGGSPQTTLNQSIRYGAENVLRSTGISEQLIRPV